MPLPHIKKFCCAKCKATGNNCLNPAAFGMPVCRYHGAKLQQSVKRGADHGRYKSGDYTLATKEALRQGALRIQELETMAFNAGLIRSRKAGRKPENC